MARISRIKKRKFLCYYDYGMGAVFFYMFANSEKEILDKYSQFGICEDKPGRFNSREKNVLEKELTFDISEPPKSWLKAHLEEREKNPPLKGWKKD